jgi:hypothetical protein
LTLTWQALTVQANYAGHLTGLFRTGASTRVPPALAATTYRDPSRDGYDGQFYRFIAHDPALGPATWAALDGPVVRSRRILIPALAWLAAAGRQQWIDPAYVLILAAFLFSGVYWMARVFEQNARSPAHGLLFLMVPATIVSIDRMTVDVASAALTAAFVYYQSTSRTRALWLTLGAASLVRETGLLLVAAAVLPALLRRDFRQAARWTSPAIPALAWFAYLAFTSPASPSQVSADWGIPGVLFNPPHYNLPSPQESIARALDILALLATLLAGMLAVAQALVPAASRLVSTLLLLPNRDFWTSPYAYGRFLGPLFVLLLLGPNLAPAIFLTALVDLRLFTEIRSQILGVLHWL